MNTFTETIESRKRLLEEHLGGFMGRLAEHCARGWGIRERLDQALLQSLQENDHIAASRLLYIVDINGVQLSSNIFSTGEVDESRVGQDLSARPYISTVLPSDGFFLSDVYISQRNRRSLVTAVQLIRIGEVVKGFVCVDFELGMLPEVGQPTEDRRIWMQV
ncbi:MAG: hypothetical protein HN344_08000, partial [Gammaproteobacteria bacterium]|nr:hypothetical protein [Gammaproteobacteria bacterium]